VGMADGEGITVANAESDKYPVQQLPSDPWVPVGRGSDHRWSGYFQCGYKGVFEYAKEQKLLPSDVLARGLPGLRVMVCRTPATENSKTTSDGSSTLHRWLRRRPGSESSPDRLP